MTTTTIFGIQDWKLALAIFLLLIPISFLWSFVSYVRAYRKNSKANAGEMFTMWGGAVVVDICSFGLLALALRIIARIGL